MTARSPAAAFDDTAAAASWVNAEDTDLDDAYACVGYEAAYPGACAAAGLLHEPAGDRLRN